MNRRKFLITTAVAIAAPHAAKAALVVSQSPAINPAWVNAPYQVAFAMTPETFKSFYSTERPSQILSDGTYVVYGAGRLDENFKLVPKFIVEPKEAVK